LLELADGASLLELPNAEALELAAALCADPPAGLFEAVPGARTLLLLFDPDLFDPSSLQRARRAALPEPRLLRLRAVYDGPDLAELSVHSGLAASELVRLHTAAVHTVAFLGFAPGFAYLAGAPRELAVPRLRTPRVRVPAGSLAVADGYSGVYPAQTPGGWRLIGRVAERMFDPAASPPALLRPGDRVRFEAVDALPPMPELRPPPPAGTPVLRVLSPGPFTSIQGGPRYGLSASGVPAGGAMDLPALAAANALLGNAPFAAGLEFTLAGPELEALADVRVAANDKIYPLRPGERLKLTALQYSLRGYVSVEGGLALPLAGEPTRPLLRGEILHAAPGEPRYPAPRPGEQRSLPRRRSEQRSLNPVTVRALPGPQGLQFRSPERFFSAIWTLTPQSDRRGLRLSGEPLELIRADIPPEGTAPGAVQVPADGQPIVLGPDRPVTGGYAKIATVISADLPILAQLRPGARLQFQKVTLREALEARR
jgi:KipI family sensor histidine kinase inhibitor